MRRKTLTRWIGSPLWAGRSSRAESVQVLALQKLYDTQREAGQHTEFVYAHDIVFTYAVAFYSPDLFRQAQLALKSKTLAFLIFP